MSNETILRNLHQKQKTKAKKNSLPNLVDQMTQSDFRPQCCGSQVYPSFYLHLQVQPQELIYNNYKRISRLENIITLSKQMRLYIAYSYWITLCPHHRKDLFALLQAFHLTHELEVTVSNISIQKDTVAIILLETIIQPWAEVDLVLILCCSNVLLHEVLP